jgi:hypothetical protein
LRPLVATALIPAGRGRQAAPRNQHSVEVDGEIEKSLTELFQPGADDQLPANVMDSQGGLVRQARVERAASNPAYSALAFMARNGTARLQGSSPFQTMPEIDRQKFIFSKKNHRPVAAVMTNRSLQLG